MVKLLRFLQKPFTYCSSKTNVVLFIIIFPLSVLAQQGGIRIEGRVIDEKAQEPIIGVNIFLVNEKTGTVTDLNGRFTINARSLPTTISVKYIGYKPLQIDVNEYTKPLTISIREDVNVLNEIVVVGYGTQRRKELTGSISTVPKTILEHTTTSFDGILGGAVAGMNVTQNSGQPGASFAIRIRGGNSVHAGNEPLYVIDGFIFYSDNNSTKTGLSKIESELNPLAAINPNDIESIEVLKDVSATAIYGSRGANGVIIVTTKKGKRGSNAINYQYTVGREQVSKQLDLMNATQWAQFQNQYGYNYFDEATIAALGKGYDWQEAMFRTAYTQKHELSINGGDDKTRYLISGSYVYQDGILIHTDFERYNARVNLDRNLSNNVIIGVNVTGGKSIQNGVTAVEENDPTYQGRVTNSLGYALRMPPVVPIYNPDGSYNYINPYEKHNDMTYNGENPNPISDMNNSVGQNINTSLLSNFYAQYSITEGLVAKVSLGANLSNTTQNFFSPSSSLIGLLPRGLGGIGSKRYEAWQSEYTLNYSKTFNRIHFLNVLAGYTTHSTSVRYITAVTAEFSNESLAFNNLYDGNKPDFPVSGGTESWLKSILGRVNYSLWSRYNLTVTLRADESSRFAPKHRWGYFPSVGVSWNVNEESFLKDNQTLNALKLRLTYGSVGNQEIEDNLYASNYVAQKSSENNKSITVYKKSRMGNPNLKWESTVQYNAGADIGLWKDRLIFVSDVYYKKTSDLLYNAPVEASTGFSNQMTNVGNVTNKGVEFTVNATIVESKDFTWTASANIARNINKITDLGSVNHILVGNGLGMLSSNEMILQTGESLNSFYGLIFDGVVQKGEDVSHLPKLSWKDNAPQPGDPKFVDIVADGRIDDKDRIVIGSTQPDFTYGFSTSATYKGADLFITFQGSKGNHVYNRLRRDLETPNGGYNFSAALLNGWTEINPSSRVPRISQDIRFSYLDDRFIEDASYLRLKNITIGYTLPIKINPAESTLKVRLFAVAENLFTITNYMGYDPEVGNGYDLGVYPRAKTFSIGAGLSF
jgi:TonB-linked SusC/RagA family outer membrane protein